ncbi:TraR/DksA family transcriptional regulator [bacterium]|nr:MAG: TraR/DksA family transcriptional regulator [bacterium]
MSTTKAKPKKISSNKKAAPKSKAKQGVKKVSSKKPVVVTARKVAPKAKAPIIEKLKSGVPKSGARSKEAFKKEIVKKLIVAKAKILQEVSQKVKSESDSLKFEIGDIYDFASNERERELSLTLGDRDREKLSEIEDAFERLKDNTYGQCEECGEPVAEDRLRALPFTRVCVECKSRNEREQRIKGRVEEDTGLGILEKSENEEDEY